MTAIEMSPTVEDVVTGIVTEYSIARNPFLIGDDYIVRVLPVTRDMFRNIVECLTDAERDLLIDACKDVDDEDFAHVGVYTLAMEHRADEDKKVAEAIVCLAILLMQEFGCWR